jgi:hypothetical protein
MTKFCGMGGSLKRHGFDSAGHAKGGNGEHGHASRLKWIAYVFPTIAAKARKNFAPA